MVLSATHYSARLICGLGLLLPAAVQQKVCAWPVPSEPAPPSKPGEQPKPERQPLTLAAMLPDAVTPRWPGHTQLTAVRRVQPLPATSWLDGPVGSGAQTDPDSDAVFVNLWPRPVRELSPTCADVDLRSNCARRHVFLTSILRTGPPRA